MTDDVENESIAWPKDDRQNFFAALYETIIFNCMR